MEELSKMGMTVMSLDVTNIGNIRKVRDDVAALTSGKLDILVNNAGAAYPVAATDLVLSDVRALFEVNLFAPMAMVQEFIHLLIASGDGRITHTGSVSGIMPVPFSVAYNASKAALHAFGNTIRVELAPFNIKVINVVTGTVKSNIAKPNKIPTDSLYKSMEEIYQEKRVNRSQMNAMPTEVYAKIVVTEVLKPKPRAWLWTGNQASLVVYEYLDLIEMNTTTSADLAPVLQLLRDAQATSYVAVAALTVVVVDQLMTFPQEIDLMWRGKWSAAKVLYLWNRYFSLAILAFDAYFYVHEISSDNVQGAGATMIVLTVDVVLVMRVWVLYHQSKKVLAFLVPLLLCEVVSMLTLSILTDLPLKAYAHFPSLSGCYSLVVPRFLTFYSVPALATSSVMFVMTLLKCGYSLFSERGQMPVIKLFARDGIIWFITVLLITTVNIIIWTAGRPTMAETNIDMSCALYSIIAARCLLNIKETLQRTNNLTVDNVSTIWQRGQESMEFGGTSTSKARRGHDALTFDEIEMGPSPPQL
ncbi:hypothetical protein CVT25_001503 [Psilocybe cyanescens]|uniref:DUF6533 domain-containing protein n=1 Tax=Psilocybe cyanescens TaxID=93625 RepID=A0A409WNJ4_PSICY|nr:hypothetical protein CVT25_001503 [Psilocybe cyanescens]